MKAWLLILLAVIAPARAGITYTDVPESPDPAKIHLIYLHGRIIENSGPRPTDSRYGFHDYPAVLEALSSRGAVVISAQRPPETDMNKYAGVVVSQVENLIDRGVPPENISCRRLLKRRRNLNARFQLSATATSSIRAARRVP